VCWEISEGEVVGEKAIEMDCGWKPKRGETTTRGVAASERSAKNSVVRATLGATFPLSPEVSLSGKGIFVQQFLEALSGCREAIEEESECGFCGQQQAASGVLRRPPPIIGQAIKSCGAAKTNTAHRLRKVQRRLRFWGENMTRV